MLNQFLVFSIIYLCGYLRAECDNPLITLAQNYSQLHAVNITYESTITSELSKYALDDFAKQNIKVEAKWSSHVFFCADKDKFYMEVSRDGKSKSFTAFAYDGTNYQVVHGWLKTLVVSKNNATVQADLWNDNSVSLPAAMFANSQNAANQLDSLWRNVVEPSFWATILATPFTVTDKGPITGTVNGKKITVTNAEKNSPLAALGISSIVSAAVGSDKPSSKYTFTEVGQVSYGENDQKRTFSYPKKATFQLIEVTGDVLRTDTHEITKLKIGDPNFDGAKFSIDPASVQNIYDEDTQKWIPIPK